LARELLSWEPKVDLETGLKLSMEYFQQAIEMEDGAKKDRRGAQPTPV
jgi:hypothetical protein